MMLRGRQHECTLFDGLLQAVRIGRSGALMVRGEPGVGKTALLDYAIGAATDLTVIRAGGVESEMELPFAALHQFCAPMLDRLDRLPGPQREALGTAFGLKLGPAPERLIVGLAVLGLVSEVAADRPLVCVVDDAQWLDQASAQALGFLARRLMAESVLVLFGARELGQDLRGLPELVVEGLRPSDAWALLSSVVGGPLDERVSEQIVAETRGNPLALLELPRGLTPAQLAGGFGLPGALSVSGRIEENFVQRLAGLPEDTQQLLLLAAAEPLGDPALMWRAARLLGVESVALEPAERARLLEVGTRVRFRHPLVRSAAYRAASSDERQMAHAVLADATDPELDPDRRAWHRAHATRDPDEDIAAELERSAERAQARGGLAAAAAFLERAVWLTPEPARRARRAVAAAEAEHLAGAPDAAFGLLVTAEVGPLNELARARVDLVRAQIAYSQNRSSEAAELLLRAAQRLEPLDLGLARATYLDSLSAASFAGTSAGGVGVTDVAQAVLTAPSPPQPETPADLLVDAVAMQCAHGFAAGIPMLKLALRELRRGDISSEEQLRCSLLAYRGAVDLWDEESWHVLTTRYVELARASGALPVLHFALTARIVADAFTGETTAGLALLEELRAVCEVIGSQLPPYTLLALSAWRGPEAEVSTLIDETTKEALLRGETLAVSAARWASAVLYNGLGRYEEALAAAEGAVEAQDLAFAHWSLPEVILAAVRCGRPERAAHALEQLASRARDTGSNWALGVEARSRALLSDGEEAERLYLQAVKRLGRTRIRVELARAHLLYGEWLRRERRPMDARPQLRTAREMFMRMGADVFAEHAERELLEIGELRRQRTGETREQLTEQELRVARLARDGLSNHEIGARLFISPRAVEHYLHIVFTKLEINSPHQF